MSLRAEIFVSGIGVFAIYQMNTSGWARGFAYLTTTIFGGLAVCLAILSAFGIKFW